MKYFELENFRLFKKRNQFDLAPLTILTGKNNSGKSSLFKALLLINDYISSDNHLILNLDGPFKQKHRLTHLNNIFTWDSDNYFSFKYHNEYTILEFIFIGEPESKTAYLNKFTLQTVINNQSLVIQRLTDNNYDLKFTSGFFHALNETFEIERGEDLNDKTLLIDNLLTIKKQIKELKAELKNQGISEIELININSKLLGLNQKLRLGNKIVKGIEKVYNSEEHSFRIEFDSNGLIKKNLGFIISKVLNKKYNDKLFVKSEILHKKYIDANFSFKSIFSEINSRLEILFSFRVFHLSPNRFHPATYYDESTKNISEFYNVLKSYKTYQPKLGLKKDLFFKKWLQKFNLCDDIIFEEFDKSLYFLEYKINNKAIKVVDQGFGSGQLLSILMKIAGLPLHDPVPNTIFAGLIAEIPTPGKKILIIEEPESNIHPHFQSLLAEMLLEAALQFHLIIIIETHSEYLIRNTQTMVKSKKNSNYFKVYYLKQGSHFEMIYLDNGRFQNEFEEGFFDEAAKQAFKLL